MSYAEIFPEYKDVLTPEDLQVILKAGRNTVYGYLASHKIRSVVIAGKYRIPKLYLAQFLYPDMDFTGIDSEKKDENEKIGEGV
ncbi:MAG: helix-turn-helix domain-containing protein [Lachnospiraceae bacterium]|nr:helix-turn-helix domain-containing protein [Lachnospiraceae bacterium]